MSAHNTQINPEQPVNTNLNQQQYVRPEADYYYNRQYNNAVSPYYSSYPATNYIPRASLMMAGVGAVIGGSAAAAKNIRRVKAAEIDRREAVKDTLQEAAGAGAATGVATAVMGYVNAGNLVSLLGTIVVATGTKYMWDCVTTAPKESCCGYQNETAAE